MRPTLYPTAAGKFDTLAFRYAALAINDGRCHIRLMKFRV